jgi:Domain of unknown function (DUF4150)
MFMLNNGGATAMATVPDICQTPAAPSPIPVPYPNMASTDMTDPDGLVPEVLVDAMPALNMMSKILLSEGDTAGSAGGGVVSAKVMGEMAFIDGSAVVMVGGLPAVRVTCLTEHNGSPANTVGVVSVPSQTAVLVLE